jgi:hypothetical protein
MLDMRLYNALSPNQQYQFQMTKQQRNKFVRLSKRKRLQQLDRACKAGEKLVE